MNGDDVAQDIRSRLEGDSVAIVGGTVWEEEGHKEPLRESDQKALGAENFGLDEKFEAVYGVPGDELLDAIGDRNAYVAGGTIANPFARLINANIEPVEVNSVDFGTLVSQRRFPFTFDDEGVPGRKMLSEEFPGDSDTVEWYSMTAEEFRENARPNYVIDRSYGEDGAEVQNEFNSIWVPEDGDVLELEDIQKEEYLSKRFVPLANGKDWQTDYSILGVHDNPYGDGNIVAAQGAHHLGTEGANEMITYPEGDIEGTGSALRSLGQFLEETGAENYQALIQTYRNPNTGETLNNLVAVGEL